MTGFSLVRWMTWLTLLLSMLSLSMLAWRLGDAVGRSNGAAPEQITSTITQTLAAPTATATLTPATSASPTTTAATATRTATLPPGTGTGTPATTTTVTRTATATLPPGTATATPVTRLYMPYISERVYKPVGGGGRLVWADNRGTNRKWDIWIRDEDGERQLTLGTDWTTSDEIDPMISQDGETIVFASNRHGDQNQQTNRHFEIYRMNISGANAVRLTETTGFTSVNPAISPNGQRIVFTSDAGTFNSLDVYAIPVFTAGNAALGVSSWQRLTWPDAPPTLRPSPTVPTATPSPTTTPRVDPTVTATPTLSVYDNYFRQSTSRQPTWSPDGSLVAFVSNRRGGNAGCGQEEIYVMDSTGYNQRRVTCSQGQNLWPRWSPDGSRLVFVSNRDGNWELYVIQPNGTDERRLTRTGVAESQPAWVRRTSDLIYVGFCLNAGAVTYQYGICLLRGTVGAEGRMVLPAVPGGDIYAPSWSQGASP